MRYIKHASSLFDRIMIVDVWIREDGVTEHMYLFGARGDYLDRDLIHFEHRLNGVTIEKVKSFKLAPATWKHMMHQILDFEYNDIQPGHTAYTSDTIRL